ncbi:MAG: hypothetical protein JWO20_2806 [Candidatus Angelobacter sp.]|nr:hypothetical protein [Candidatus Angelobacter sp.]
MGLYRKVGRDALGREIELFATDTNHPKLHFMPERTLVPKPASMNEKKPVGKICLFSMAKANECEKN